MTAKRFIHIQDDLFWEDQNRTPNAVEAANWFEVVKRSDEEVMSPDFTKPRMGHLIRGSMTMAQKCGLTFNFARVDKWLPALREYAVSEDGIFVDLKYARFLIGHEGAQYLRPVSPFKEFAGQVFHDSKLDKEIAWLKQGKNINPEEIMCLLAPVKYIGREYRCIFVNNEYVAGSQYMDKGELDVQPDVPDYVVAFAKKIAANEYFTNIFDFVVDVAEMAHGDGGKLFGEKHNPLRLVEINGFETASFYAADLAKIYGAWSKSLT